MDKLDSEISKFKMANAGKLPEQATGKRAGAANLQLAAHGQERPVEPRHPGQAPAGEPAHDHQKPGERGQHQPERDDPGQQHRADDRAEPEADRTEQARSAGPVETGGHEGKAGQRSPGRCGSGGRLAVVRTGARRNGEARSRPDRGDARARRRPRAWSRTRSSPAKSKISARPPNEPARRSPPRKWRSRS